MGPTAVGNQLYTQKEVEIETGPYTIDSGIWSRFAFHPDPPICEYVQVAAAYLDLQNKELDRAMKIKVFY